MTIKEAGATARSALSIFRREPLVLALVLMNAALLGLLYWNAVIADGQRRHEMDLIYDNRKVVTDALSRCYPAPPQQAPGFNGGKP